MEVSPVLIYLEGKTVFRQVGCQPHDQIAELPDPSQLRAVVQQGQAIFLLQNTGIQRIDLSTDKIDLLLPFDSDFLYGTMMSAPDQQRIFYTETFTDLTSSMGVSTNVGYFEPDGSEVHSILTEQNAARILGPSADGKALYCLPLGQDPEFGEVQVIDIATGKIGKELPVRGYDTAVLGPDALALATFFLQINSKEEYENSIKIYDLPSLPLTPPKTYTLPNAPSWVRGGDLEWSPDGQSLYFLLLKNPGDDPMISYGLWQLNVQSGKMSQIVPEFDGGFHLVSMSPDSQWILLKHEDKEESLLVDLKTGETNSFSSPVLAYVVGWQ